MQHEIHKMLNTTLAT